MVKDKNITAPQNTKKIVSIVKVHKKKFGLAYLSLSRYVIITSK